MSRGENPFPGPQPYSASDRARFFGRDEMALELVDEILSHRVLTVYGPSGAGKSSLLQASVLPRLMAEEGVRCVTVDSWPQRVVAESGPVCRLTEALAHTLGLGDVRPDDLESAIELAFLVSERPLLLLLDQIEQLLVPHPPEVLQSLVVRLAELERWRGGNLHVLITLREDYLGRWSALLARRPRLIRHSFRVRRLTSPEVTEAVIQTAASAAQPQTWRPEQIAPYIGQMELAGEWRADGAEVETAYVQIVCRQLFAAGGPSEVDSGAAQILERYLRDSLAALGDLQQAARDLLATRFVHGESGRRVQVSREEVFLEVGSEAAADRILGTLEEARILRARQHQGVLLFELGHDWLAQPVREEVARQREVLAARRRRRRRFVLGGVLLGSALLAVAFAGLAIRAQLALAEAEHQAELAREAQAQAGEERDRAVLERQAADRARLEADAARRTAEGAREQSAQSQALEEAAKQRALDALQQVDLARQDLLVALSAAEESERLQRQRAREARDGQRMLAVRELAATPHRAVPFLVAIRPESHVSGWREAAWRMLQIPLAQPIAGATIPTSPPHITSNREGVWVATARGGAARIGQGATAASNAGPVEAIAGAGDTLVAVHVGAGGRRTMRFFTPLGAASFELGEHPVTAVRLLRASGPAVAVDMAGTIHVVSAFDTPPVRVQLQAPLSAVVPVGDDLDFVVASTDGSLRKYDHSGRLMAETRLERSVLALANLGDQVVAAGVDGALHLWSPGGGPPTATGRIHDAFVIDVQPRPGHPKQLLSFDQDGLARLVRFVDGDAQVSTPMGLQSGVRAAAWSRDGSLLAIGGDGGVATIWWVDDAGRPLWRLPLVAHGADARVVGVRFVGRDVVSIDDGGRAFRWSVETQILSRVVRSPGGPAPQALSYSSDGTSLWAKDPDGWSLVDGGSPRGDRVHRGASASSEDGAIRATLAAGGVVSVLVDGVHPFELVSSPAEGRVLTVAADGSRVAVALADGSIRSWSLHDEARLQRHLSSLAPRCALAKDRVRFLGDLPREAAVLERQCSSPQGTPQGTPE